MLILLLACAAHAQDEERIQSLYNQAEAAHERGDLMKAIELYKETIKLAPELFEPKYQCAIAALATGKPELAREAVALLKEVVALKPDFARAHAALGSALARVNDNSGAEAALVRALELDGKLKERALLAELLLERKAYKEAQTQLEALAAEGRADARSHLLLGIAQQGQGRAKEALASYTRVIELAPNDADARYRRGLLYIDEKNYSAASADLEPAYEASGNADIGYALAEAYAGAGKKEEAKKLAQTLLEKATRADERTALAELLARLGANEEAIAQLERSVKAEPKNAAFLARLGELYLATDAVKSVDYWQRAVALDGRAEYLVGLASALLKAQRFEESIHHFNMALAQKADSYEAHAGLGLALFKLERFPQAAEQFIWVVRARPENAIAAYFLGICFDRMGDYVQALRAYELFMRRADVRTNKSEIENVQVRLPQLRQQVEKLKKKG